MTLLELTVALIVLALVVAVAAPVLQGVTPRWQLRGAAHQVENIVRLAQNAAATGNRGVQVMYDVPEGALWVRTRGSTVELGRHKLPGGVQFKRVRFSTGIEVTADVAAAGVYSDGTLDPHVVILTGGAGYARMAFDRLTGGLDYQEGTGDAPGN